MASVRYIILAACQNASLYAQAGWESEAAAWIEKQGSRPCAYVGYRRGQGVAGFDNVSVVFGGSDPRAALRRVRDSLERSLEFRSERQTEVDGFPALVMTARSKRRVYGVFGGGVGPTPPTPPTPTGSPMYFEAVQANSTVALMSMLETAPNLEYSTDGETWQEWQHTTAEGTHTFDTITLTAVGDRVYLRGVNPAGFLDLETEAFSLFSMTGKIAAGGNVQSLVDGDTPTLVAKTMPIFCDYMITQTPSDVLTAAPSLPATTLSVGCYVEMFGGCTGLTAAPSLPATTLAEECYVGMFDYCTGLTAAPSLPATTLSVGCYVEMFDYCTGLTAAPSLPATTLAEECYAQMFDHCTGLTAAPSLPATTLSFRCYREMFRGCTGLTAAPSLPATTLAEECYVGMFDYCTGLTAAPSLPATTLSVGCYVEMFDYCTGLTAAPSLPATTLSVECYSGMFSGCTFDMSDDGTTFNFQCGATLPQTVGDETYTTPVELANWMGNTNGFTEPSVGPMYFEAVEPDSTVALVSDLETAPDLEYSTDGETWQEWQHTTAEGEEGEEGEEGVHTFDTITLGAVGDRVYLRGDNPNGLSSLEGSSNFILTGSVNCGGNVMSLLDTTMALTVVPQYGFQALFTNQPALLTPPSMDTITAVTDGGCMNMCEGCTSLTIAANMPQLTTVGFGGFGDMYNGCTSITAAANMPRLTTIGDNGCNGMYYGCTSLTAAADMPALTTIGYGGCHDMYEGCVFDMSDDGTTLNFDFPAPPVVVGASTYATAYDVANWMGNTNGFTNP